MKKIKVISCIIILLFLLTACVSDAEREKGKENLKEGKILIKEYVRNTYGEDAKASDFKEIYIRERYDSTVPNLNRIASGYVHAAVSIDDIKFEILYNVYTDEVLTNKNMGIIQNSFLSYVNDKLQLNNVIDCQISLYAKAMDVPHMSNFIEPDIMTYEELVSLDKYNIELTCRCINSDFDNITEQKWQQLLPPYVNETTECSVEIVVVNFEDEEGYEAEAEHDFFEVINSEILYYASEEAKQYTKNIIYISQKDIEALPFILKERDRNITR